MKLVIELQWLLGGVMPILLVWISATIKQLVDIGSIKEHLRQLNGRLGKAEDALTGHINTFHNK